MSQIGKRRQEKVNKQIESFEIDEVLNQGADLSNLLKSGATEPVQSPRLLIHWGDSNGRPHRP